MSLVCRVLSVPSSTVVVDVLGRRKDDAREIYKLSNGFTCDKQHFLDCRLQRHEVNVKRRMDVCTCQNLELASEASRSKLLPNPLQMINLQNVH